MTFYFKGKVQSLVFPVNMGFRKFKFAESDILQIALKSFANISID